MKHAALIGIAVLCAAAAWGADRFGHEICHRGIPLAALAMGAPAVGLASGFAAVAMRPPRWMFGMNTVFAALNIYFLTQAIRVAAGVGFLSCR